MLAAGRSLLARCLFVQPKALPAALAHYSTTVVKTPAESATVAAELSVDEPVIPEDVEAGVADTEEVAIVRQKMPYSRNVLSEMKLDQYPYYVEREWWKKGNRMTFWSTWRMLRDVRRREALSEFGAERMRLKALKFNTVLPQAVRDEAAERLHNGVPRYSRPNLILNMCQFTGRRRGKIKPYRVNRHVFRRLADHGQLAGVQRAMW